MRMVSLSVKSVCRLLLGSWMLLPCLLQAQSGEVRQKLSGAENYAWNRPGLVMIRTEYSANVYVNNLKMDNRAFNVLLDSIQRLDNGGGVPAEQKLDIVLREMNNRPGRFFHGTFEYIKQPGQITATGTGFFFSSTGYVATNCHLIERETSFIRRQFILTAFQQNTEANISALESAWATHFNEQQRSLLYNTYASVYSRLGSMVLYDLKKNIYVVSRSDKPGDTAGQEKMPATVVISGAPMPGKDIAILKVDPDGKEMPVLRISDQGLPRVGEQLYVYGYPGPVTNNDFLASASAIEPTLTFGIVSAIRNSVYGWPLIQMDANINHGSSGGPVCNEQGEVVGLTTFGSLENSGGLAAGLNFAIPVTILREYLDTAGVVPHAGRVTALFIQGVEYSQHRHYSAALRKFGEVVALNRTYPDVYSWIARCQEGIRKGQDRRAGPAGYMLIWDIVLLALLAGVTGLLIWWKKIL